MSDREVCPDHGQPKGMRYKDFCCDCLRAEIDRLSAEVVTAKQHIANLLESRYCPCVKCEQEKVDAKAFLVLSVEDSGNGKISDGK